MPRSAGSARRLARALVAPQFRLGETRLAVTMSPARAILRVVGYEMTNADLLEQVTEVCEI
jgi:hypothetical protein